MCADRIGHDHRGDDAAIRLERQRRDLTNVRATADAEAEITRPVGPKADHARVDGPDENPPEPALRPRPNPPARIRSPARGR